MPPLPTVVTLPGLLAALAAVLSACAEDAPGPDPEPETSPAFAVSQCVTLQRAEAPGAVADTTVGFGLGAQGGQTALQTSFSRFALVRFDLAAIPADATVTSARLTVSYRDLGKTLFGPTAATLHRVTAAWDEATVTLASFGLAIDAATVGRLAVPRTGGGFRSTAADVTGVVREWQGGTPNHGLLIFEPWVRGTEYRSSEAVADRPALEVCFDLPTASPCAPNPCGNGGTCEVTADGTAACLCQPGWRGPTCADDLDECALVGLCFSFAGCTNLPGSYQCAPCPAGYEGDGVTCRDVDGCDPNPCFEPGSCGDVPAPGEGFTCAACPPGYAGDGVTCTQCPPGYIGQGNECVDRDECALVGLCWSPTGCTNLPGSYQCAPCPAGYEGDGVTCRDVDGCDPNPCFEPGSCVDAVAPAEGFTCAACPPNYAGDGLTCTECPPGYVGQGSECVDRDECALVGLCFSFAGCTNLPGSYQCAPCPAGYEGDGVTCRDVDGCDPNPCFEPATCVDAVAPAEGFTCGACPEGTTGDGILCDPGNGPWSRPLGRVGGSAVVTDVEVTRPAEDVIATGYFTGTITLGADSYTATAPAGGTDLFVVRYNAVGAVLWSRHLAATGALRATNIDSDRGDVYITAEVEGDVDLGGGVLIAAGAHDIALFKLDATGAHVWSRRMGRGAAVGGTSLAVSDDGLVYLSFVDLLAGSSLRHYDRDGNLVWQQGGAFYQVATDEADRLYTLGSDHVLAQRTSAGAVITSRPVAEAITGTVETQAFGVGPGAEPEVWVAGRFTETARLADGGLWAVAFGREGFVERLVPSATGFVATTVRVFGGPGEEVVTRLEVDDAGFAVMAGYTTDAWTGLYPLPHLAGEDGFLIILDDIGFPFGKGLYGGPGDQRVLGVGNFSPTVTLDRAIGGSNTGTIDLRTGTYSAPLGAGYVARVPFELAADS